MSIRAAQGWEPLMLRPPLEAGGRLLIFSDSPEEVRRHGVMYREQVNRPFRVFLHHVNMTGAPAGVYIYVCNPTDRPLAVTARATGAGWGPDPGDAGCRAVRDYLGNRAVKTVWLRPGAFTRWGVDRLGPRTVYSGAYNFDPQGPVRVCTALVPAGSNPHPDQLPVLAADGLHGRGTWLHGTRRGTVAFRASLGAVGVQLGNRPSVAGAAPWDTPLAGEFELGQSSVDRHAAELVGNYGVVYQMELDLVNDTAEPRVVEVIFHPRGGVFRAAVELGGRVTAMASAIGSPEHAWWAAQVRLAPGERRQTPLRWMPAGGSALPVCLLLVAKPG